MYLSYLQRDVAPDSSGKMFWLNLLRSTNSPTQTGAGILGATAEFFNHYA